MLYLTQLTGVVLIVLINGEVGGDCPPEHNDLDLKPPKLVVQYGDPVTVRCFSLSNFTDFGWRDQFRNVSSPNNHTVTWETDSLTDWEIELVCYKNLDDVQCSRTLPITIYKLPDRVSINTVNHTGSMTEGSQYELQCGIQDVAPVHLLIVNWYKGSELVNTTSFTDSSTKSPMNQSTTLQITPTIGDDGVQYRCEAELNLPPEVHPFRPKVTSDPFNITISTQFIQCSDLELDPPKLVVRYGDPASVSCRSLSNYTDLGWRAPLGNVLRPDNRTVTWETDNLTDWEIQPVCYRALDDGQCRRALPLIVYKLPDQVSLSIMNHTGPMTAGRKYDLQCDIQNFAPVYVLAVFWYKGDTLLKNRGFNDLPTKMPSNKTVTLKISPSKDDVKAQYRCEAKLKLGQEGPQPTPIVTSNVLKTVVHYKPVITCSDWSPMINTSLNSYPYNFMGNPPPIATWYRDKSLVSSNMRLSKDDSGQYEYVASNLMGSTSCTTKITVEYAPIFDCLASYEQIEHSSLIRDCSVMASPEAAVTWEKDGKMVSPLHRLTRGDSGSYVITAVNKHGTVKHSLTVNVLYGPEIKPFDSSEVVKEGGIMTLNCTAEGNPEPEVMWSFRDQTKATGRRQTILTITKASLDDDGVYTCTAKNDPGGISETTVSLRVESDFPIKIQPARLVVEFGASATANCSTTTTHYGMGWEAPLGPVEMVTDVQFLTWKVDSLTTWDIVPICYLTTDKQYDVTLQVIVYKPPDRVSISTVNHTGPMIEGKQYKLQCEVKNVAPVHLLTVNWYKGQRLVHNESFPNKTKSPDSKTLILQISTSKDDDGAQYRCEAELKLGPEGPQPPPTVTSDPLNITVYYKPVITCSDWSPMINTSLNSYPYNFMGNPPPIATWYRDKSPVSSNMRLSKDDSGQYEYVASNLMGSTSCTTKITVEYAPIFDCLASYEQIEHSSLIRDCSVMASPEAAVIWEKDGKMVSPLHRLTRGDSGSYVITAVNKHGTVKHSLTINVLYGPEIQQVSSSKEVKVGKDVSLSCTAKGNPEPKVEWSFQNQTKATGRLQVMLNISEVKLSDAGEYTCTATNEHGRDTRAVSLTVAESNIRTIIICCGITLAILLIVACIIPLCVKRKRSGRYNIQSNGAVSMKLMSQNDGEGMTET